MAEQDIAAEGIRRQPRVVGLSGFSTPSLEAVERRRLHLWIVNAVLLVAISLAVVTLSILSTSPSPLIPAWVLRVSIVLMTLAFCFYSVEKEIRFHRLSTSLIDERVLSTALTSRLHEFSVLLQSGRAINSVLDLDAVLDNILTSASELVGGSSGSIMLREGDELVIACVQGNDAARGRRVRIGQGIAGMVAAEADSLLIDGKADPAKFPGLSSRGTVIQSAMSTPLVNREEVVGVLNVNAAPGRAFTEYDLRAMSVFAEQAAAAIFNARLYEAEREQVSELMRLDKLKSEFVALVSHELRTPITSILAASSIAQRPEMAAQRPEMDDIVQRQAQRLDGMVGDLLAAGQLERAESLPHLEQVDVASLVRLAAADASVAGLSVQVEGPATAYAEGDSEWLRRVFDNLLDNARKYGEPPVSVQIREEAEAVVVEVRDQGPGVPEDQREQVFERFQRLDASRGQPGLGLGLSIVRGLMRRLGGDVWVGEAPGSGAAFLVSVPRAQQVEQAV